MSETIIKVSHLTKDYGHNRGVFDINFEVKKGEVFGYIGTNGSGKTTTIRQMMGFIKPDCGESEICGLNSWQHSSEIMNKVSYVPGEIAFPSLASGTDFLKLQAEYLGVEDLTYMNHVIELLQLDPTANLKRMSKGMKQKTAIVAALMGDKDILVLDEPTTGLDPLMRDTFLELVKEEKAKGRTIFMSSHIFEEIEEVCDRVAMIKDGKILDIVDLWQIRHWKTKKFDLTFASHDDLMDFTSEWKNVESIDLEHYHCQIKMATELVDHFFKTLKKYHLRSLREEHFTLEQYFQETYQEEQQ